MQYFFIAHTFGPTYLLDPLLQYHTASHTMGTGIILGGKAAGVCR